MGWKGFTEILKVSVTPIFALYVLEKIWMFKTSFIQRRDLDVTYFSNVYKIVVTFSSNKHKIMIKRMALSYDIQDMIISLFVRPWDMMAIYTH